MYLVRYFKQHYNRQSLLCKLHV